MISSGRGAQRIRGSARPCPPRATLAQLVERLIRNQQVAGSIPAGGSTKNTVVNSNPLNQLEVLPEVLKAQPLLGLLLPV